MKKKKNICIYIFVLFVDLGRAHATTFAFVFINLYISQRNMNHMIPFNTPEILKD